MYESKYKRFVTKSQSRFAEPEEIIDNAELFNPRKAKIPAGIPVFHEGGRLYVDNTDSHTIVIGPTGCKKTRTTVFSSIGTMIEAGESIVINDPKGEIYRRTSDKARAAGAKVHVLNFRNPDTSDYWNPLSLAYKYHRRGREADAVQCINDFCEAICAPSAECTNDRYWIDSAKTYLTALALSLMASVPKAYFNISNLIQLCFEQNRQGLMAILSKMDPASTAAFGLHTVLDLEADRTRSCIYSALLAAVSPFTQNRAMRDLLCDSTFDVSAIGDTQTIIYIIYPDEKTSMNFLVNAFFTQCYEALVVAASNYPLERLPVRVNFIYDEFSNLPAIPSFDNRISEARSRNIRYFLFIQSFNQLKQKYSECAETILSNCSNWICFSSKEVDFLAKISAVCGKEVDYNGFEHDLISPFDMQHLEKTRTYTEVLIVRQGMFPYVAKLPDIDSVRHFKKYTEARLSEVRVKSRAKYLTFDEWFQGIKTGFFRFPYYKGRKSEDECA